MDFVWFMILVLAVAQIESICVCKYMLNLEKKYCSGCDWWFEDKIIFMLTLIPFVGLFFFIPLGIDCIRNIVNALTSTENV